MSGNGKKTVAPSAEVLQSVFQLLQRAGYSASASALQRDARLDGKAEAVDLGEAVAFFREHKKRAAPATAAPPAKKQAPAPVSAESDSGSESDSESSDSESEKPVAKKGAAPAGRAESDSSDSESSDSDSESEKPVAKKPAAAPASAGKAAPASAGKAAPASAGKKAAPAPAPSDSGSSSSSESESSESEDEKPITKKPAAAPTSAGKAAPAKAKSSSSSDESSSSSESEEEEAAPPAKKAKTTPAPKAAATPATTPATTPASSGSATGEFKIYVKGLPWSAGESDVRDFFKSCGKVLSAECPADESGRSTGTAFVRFGKRAELDAAVARDGETWPGTERWLKIVEAFEKPERRTFSAQPGARPEGCDTVFVGNLPWDIDEDTMRGIFSEVGEIQNVRFGVNEDGSFKGFGHVSFYDGAHAEAAVKLAGTDVNGRAIRVDYAPPRNRDGGGGGGRGGGGRGDFSPRGGGRSDFSPRGGGRGRGGRDGGRGRGGGRGDTMTAASKNKGSIAASTGKKMNFGE